MLYIFDTEIPNNKSVFLSLSSVYGLGSKKALVICKHLGFSKNLKTNMLTQDHINLIIKIVETLNIKVSNELKKFKLINFKSSILIKSYKGFRKNQGLPVRGQRTHTNAKTAKKKIFKNLFYDYFII